MKRKLLVPLLLSVVAAGRMAAAAEFDDDGSARRANLKKAVAATVRILCGVRTPAGQVQALGTGSGVIVSPDGTVITNHHVVVDKATGGACPELWAGLVDAEQGFLPPNRVYRLRLIASDAVQDLAVLRLQPKGAGSRTFPFLRLASRVDLFYGASLDIMGFPEAGGPTTTIVRAGVVGLDDREGWIKVDGGLMHGVSGGTALDERGRLVGIPTRVQIDQDVQMFDDEQLPVGNVLGSVGFVRSSEAVLRFLASSPLPPGPASEPTPESGLSVSGRVVDEVTQVPVAGATVAILSPRAEDPASHVSRDELLGWAISGADGRFVINRLLRPGPYLAKVVNPDYINYIPSLQLTAHQTAFEIKIRREMR